MDSWWHGDKTKAVNSAREVKSSNCSQLSSKVYVQRKLKTLPVVVHMHSSSVKRNLFCMISSYLNKEIASQLLLIQSTPMQRSQFNRWTIRLRQLPTTLCLSHKTQACCQQLCPRTRFLTFQCRGSSILHFYKLKSWNQLRLRKNRKKNRISATVLTGDLSPGLKPPLRKAAPALWKGKIKQTTPSTGSNSLSASLQVKNRGSASSSTN